MTTRRADVASDIARLRAALEEIAAALANADLDGLLQAEGSLELALRRLAAMPATLPESDREAIRLEVRAARQMLDRCRTLGDSLLDVVRLSMEAQGRRAGYGPAARATTAYEPRSVNTTG